MTCIRKTALLSDSTVPRRSCEAVTSFKGQQRRQLTGHVCKCVPHSHSIRIWDHAFISTCLSVCEVVLAEPLPQQPVLSEDSQLGTHLSQADQVPAVRHTLHDVQLQTGRKVGQTHACRCGLKGQRHLHLFPSRLPSIENFLL